MKRVIEKYASFVAEKAHVILAAVILFTLISLAGFALTKTESMSYRDMVPENVEEIDAIFFIADEFGTYGESAMVVAEINPAYANSTEVRDIRDPEVIRCLDVLEQKIRKMQGVISVTGAADVLRELNSGHLPKTKSRIMELMNREIVINQSSLSLSKALTRLSAGLKDVEEGLLVQKQIAEGMALGLNGSSLALSQISYAISSIAEGISQEQDLSKVTQTISLINSIEALVQSSNATQSEKAEIIGYLEGLKQGLNAMLAQTQEAQEGMKRLSASLNEMAYALENISSGLGEMRNMSLMLENLSLGLKEGVSGIRSGIEGIAEYAKLYEGEKKQEKTVKMNPFKYYVSDDYTTSVIRINLAEMSREKRYEFVDELERVVRETEKPAGLELKVTGEPVIARELKKQVQPTMRKTSTFSLICIFAIVCLLFLSLRYGIISLLAIGFGVVWVYGTLGLLGIPINPSMSGGISMIMGIGIDFGIQVVNRFREERKKRGIEEAMKVTLSSVFVPMLVTTLAALIGFRAMSLGELTLLADLGNMMSLGVLFCFIAAITVVPSVLVISEKLKERLSLR